MKVVAINGSPNKGDGNTALILNPFIEGMRGAGAEVELFYTKKMKIHPCNGDHVCHLKTPGICPIKDDMEMLMPKLVRADVWVFATPVYFQGMSGALKNLFDRLFPLLEANFEVRDGHSRLHRRRGTIGGKVVLVSNCGNWEIDNFDQLLEHVKTICMHLGKEFSGALLRPHGGGMRHMIAKGISIEDIFDAAEEAGRQLVKDGTMRPETLEAVSSKFLTIEQYMQLSNEFLESIFDLSTNEKR